MRYLENIKSSRQLGLCALLLSLVFLQGALPQERRNVDLPCSFENNLISLNLSISDGDTLSFYLDTGGKNFLYRSGRKKLKLGTSRKNIWSKSGLEEHFLEHQIPLPYLEELRCMKDKSQLPCFTIDYPSEMLYFD